MFVSKISTFFQMFDHHLIQIAKFLIEAFEFIFEYLLCSVVKICFTIIEFHVESTLTWRTKENIRKMKNENKSQNSNLKCEKMSQTMKEEKKFNDLKFNEKINMNQHDQRNWHASLSECIVKWSRYFILALAKINVELNDYQKQKIFFRLRSFFTRDHLNWCDFNSWFQQRLIKYYKIW